MGTESETKPVSVYGRLDANGWAMQQWEWAVYYSNGFKGSTACLQIKELNISLVLAQIYIFKSLCRSLMKTHDVCCLVKTTQNKNKQKQELFKKKDKISSI